MLNKIISFLTNTVIVISVFIIIAYFGGSIGKISMPSLAKESLMIVLIILLSVLIIGILFLATQMQITTVKTGTEKYITQGEDYVKTIDENTPRHWFWKFFGVYFVGWKFQNYGIKKISINTDEENPQADKLDPSTWVIKKEKNKEVDEIWKKIPRLLIVMNAELGGEEPLQVQCWFFNNLSSG